MRMHIALRLISVVIPLPVTGGATTAEKGWRDFDMREAPMEKEEISDRLNALIQRELITRETWINEEELDNNPSLVETLSVKPPKVAEHIWLVRIGQGASHVDLQPSEGTHVKQTGEIGRVRIPKIEKKGLRNRRVHIVFDKEN